MDVWKDYFVNKIEVKHGILTSEVEEVLFSRLHVPRSQKGHVKGEDLYAAYGQTDAGRYLIVIFLHKERAAAMPISAREMSDSEGNYYAKQAKNS